MLQNPTGLSCSCLKAMMWSKYSESGVHMLSTAFFVIFQIIHRETNCIKHTRPHIYQYITHILLNIDQFNMC